MAFLPPTGCPPTRRMIVASGRVVGVDDVVVVDPVVVLAGADVVVVVVADEVFVSSSLGFRTRNAVTASAAAARTSEGAVVAVHGAPGCR